jgi:VanZ family protein
MLAAIVVYATLYPFSGWRVAGVNVFAFLALPWPAYWTWFDLVANLLGYLPLGAMAFGALVRSGWPAPRAAAVSLAASTALSFTLETLQNFLPQRVSSNVDLGLNVAGAGLGLLLAWLLHRAGAIDRWQSVRDRWFIDRSAGGLSLLFLWPVGLLFPTPVPLGLGQILSRLREMLADALEGTAAADLTAPWLQVDDAAAVLTTGGEFVAVTVGLLAPCLLAFSISRPGWRRGLLVLAAAGLGFAATTLSTALNFGPQHALAWNTGVASAAFLVGTAVAFGLTWVPRRSAAGLGLIALTALTALVTQAPADPYFSESLQAWEQGRFIRFHGAAQWVGWVWPYATLTYLLTRVAAQGDE